MSGANQTIIFDDALRTQAMLSPFLTQTFISKQGSQFQAFDNARIELLVPSKVNARKLKWVSVFNREKEESLAELIIWDESDYYATYKPPENAKNHESVARCFFVDVGKFFVDVLVKLSPGVRNNWS